MAQADSESPEETFFNDLPQQRPDANSAHSQEACNDATNKPKRIACILCRKRKLRCDGARPTCATCKRLSHDCSYDEVRKKSGPKRGYVKLLEQRLQQVETLLKNQDSTDTTKGASRQDTASAYITNTIQQSLPNAAADFTTTPNPPATGPKSQIPGLVGNNGEQDFPWEMIGLGLEEPLPPQDIIDELYNIYFSKIHESTPIIHRPRFMAALNLAPHMRPPICLRYIMWTLAASVTDKYEALQEHFYQRARKYAQIDEMKGHGESTITLAHCQTWILAGSYEFKQMYFPRAWLSAGRAVRLLQMMQLHRLDGAGLDVKQCLPPPKDWTEREERRRTFWMAFCIDRYASMGTGWPMSIDERDIMTNLPASEEAFEKNRPVMTGTLDQVLSPNGAANLQSFGSVCLTAAMFGRNLLHLHRPGPDDRDHDINGNFWNRHRQIEQILLQTALGLPDHLRLPAGLTDPKVVFANMCIHTSAICLHQAAIFKADKYQLPGNVSNESKIRSVTAAAEIASIMKMISHVDLGGMNPFISFCVYVAARVFVQYLKIRSNDQQMRSALQFLLQAMQALRRKNPLTESFLVQLDLDLDSACIPGLQATPYLPSSTQATVVSVELNAVCSPVFEIKEHHHPNAPINPFGTGNSTIIPQNTSQYPDDTPGPTFHSSSINSVDLNQQNGNFTPGQLSSSTGMPLPTSANTPDFPSGLVFTGGSEMDISSDRGIDQPSPATMRSHSRGGSTSQSSYSPNQQSEHHLPYRASPNPPLGQLPGVVTADTTVFPGFTSSSGIYSNTFSTSGNLGDDVFQNGFLMGNDWEYNAMNIGTGMTPMGDAANWDSLLEVTIGSMGPPRGHAAGARWDINMKRCEQGKDGVFEHRYPTA